MALFIMLLLLCISLPALASEIKIGVLANNGSEKVLKTWQPLAEYLGQAVPGQNFRIVPLNFDVLYPAVQAGQVDFIIVNTAQYVEMETLFGVSRIATLRNAGPDGFYTVFGGVLFTKAGRSDISQLTDLRGRKVAAVDETSLGGWLTQLRVLKAAKVEPEQFAMLKFFGNHEEVVRAVLSGQADVGAVRTDILERMAKKGQLDLNTVKIINEHSSDGFLFKHSTALYPEWPFAKLQHTDDQLASKVIVALLSLPPDSPAAKAANSGGWTIGADYKAVHELYRELKLGPYRDMGKFSLADVVQKYWPVLLLSLVLLAVLAIATVVVTRTNRRLTATLAELDQANVKLDKANTLLMESIHYARRIQEAFLSEPRALSGTVPELAVRWEPLNVVGGDYYWLANLDHRCLLMIADCTGHGVPGALLTMVLAAAIEGIVGEGRQLEPAAILHELDKQVRTRLRQDQPDALSDDGLDAAVCMYDSRTATLLYAGAGIPLLFNSNGEMKEIRAMSASLGYRTVKPKDFAQHQLTVEPGMAFYLFTDGVFDQMGGQPKRLFGRKRVARFLAGCGDASLEDQLDALCGRLVEYRGQEPRRDDMTMLAFRL